MFILLAAFFDSSSFHSLHTLHACTPKISSATSFNISHSLSTRVLHPRKIRPCLPIGVGLRWVSTLCANCLSGSLTFTVYTPPDDGALTHTIYRKYRTFAHYPSHREQAYNRFSHSQDFFLCAVNPAFILLSGGIVPRCSQRDYSGAGGDTLKRQKLTPKVKSVQLFSLR